MASSTLRSAALGPARKFFIIVSALLSNESAPSTALEHNRLTRSSVTKSEQFCKENTHFLYGEHSGYALLNFW